MSRLDVEPPQPPIQWIPRGMKWPGYQVNTHLHLMLRLGTSEATPILPLCACLAWLYFTKLTGRQMGLDFSSVG